MVIVGVAEAGRAENAEAFEDEVANFMRVFDAVKNGGVQGIAGAVGVAGGGTAAARRLHVDVGEAEQAL